MQVNDQLTFVDVCRGVAVSMSLTVLFSSSRRIEECFEPLLRADWASSTVTER
jgi:hypothetical protein